MLILQSGGACLEARDDGRLLAWCSDDEERDQPIGDLKDHRIKYSVEPDPEDEMGYIVLIERGFLCGSDKAA